MNSITVAIVLGLLLASASRCVGSEPETFGCQPERRCFLIMSGPDQKAAIAAEITVGVYPRDTTLETIDSKLQHPASAELPESLVVQQQAALRTGDQQTVLKLFADPPSVEWARALYEEMGRVRAGMQDVKTIQFLKKAYFGPVVRLTYRTVPVPGKGMTLRRGNEVLRDRGLTMNWNMVQTKDGYRFIKPSSDTAVFDTLETIVPADGGKGEGLLTDGCLKLTILYPKADSQSQDEKKRQATGANVYVRVASPGEQEKALLDNMKQVFLHGTDKDVEALYDQASIEELRPQMAGESGKEFRKNHHDYFTSFPGLSVIGVIRGAAVDYIIVDSPKAHDVGEKDSSVARATRLLRATRGAGKLLLTLQAPDDAAKGDLLLQQEGLVFLIADTLRHQHQP